MRRNRVRGQRSLSGAGALTLDRLETGKTGRISGFLGGRGFRGKMNGMGLFPGTEIEVLHTDGEEGMMLISAGGTRIMIGRAMAAKIAMEA